MCRKGFRRAPLFEWDDVLRFDKCASRLASELESQEDINEGVFNLSLYIPACAYVF